MQHIERDPEGFLCNIDDWDESIANLIAAEEQITLNKPHWEIVYLIRQYHDEYDSSPAMRALIKYTSLHLGKDKASSIYLLKLFPGSPAKLAAKIAGIPKPANCL